MNNVTLVGNLGNDPESINTQSGKAFTKFSLATTDGWGDNRKTNWHRCKCFGKVAEIVADYARKGHKISVSGYIDYSEYEKKWFTDIVVQEVTLIGKVEKSGGAPSQESNDDVDWEDED